MGKHCCTLFTLLFALLVGCRDDGAESTSAPLSQDDIRAEELLSTVIDQYRSASSYQDQAVLYLSYRLNGRAIEEPHPWSLAWNRDGVFAGDWFNTKLRCDGQRLSCYVFDIETGNLDNQQILIPSNDLDSLEQIFDDSIASHFLFGGSELPLDPSELSLNQLVQPILGLMMPELVDSCVDKPDRLTRLEDDDSTGSLAYVLRLVQNGRAYRVWIDQQSGMIEQVEFPLEYLNSEVLSAKEISQLSLFVRFHDARLNGSIPPERTAVKQRLAATTVRRFVKLPEPLPSARIGEHVGDIEFRDAAGQPIRIGDLKEKVRVLHWLSTGDDIEFSRKLVEQLRMEHGSGAAVWLVYGDEMLDANSSRLAPLLREAADSLNVGLLHDAKLAAVTSLELKSLPSIMILDRESRMQYVVAPGEDEWLNKVAVAVARISSGEQLADEMREQYDSYLDEYHEQLLLVGTDSEPVDQTDRTRPIDEVATLIWEVESIRRPGNIHQAAGSENVLVLDGWQTIVEISPDGKMLDRRSLDLPEDVAVNRIRSHQIDDGRTLFALYSVLGKQVFLFDESWNCLGAFPDEPRSSLRAGLTECELGDFDDDAEVELRASFRDGRGLVQFEIDTSESRSLVSSPVKSFATLSSGLLVVDGEGQLLLDSRPVGSDQNSRFESVKKCEWESSCALAISKTGDSLRKSLKKLVGGTLRSTLSLGPQSFDSEIDPLGLRSSAGPGAVGVVASADSTLWLFPPDSIGSSSSYSVAPPIAGVCLCEPSKPGGQLRLVIATDEVVQCWLFNRHEERISRNSPTIE